MTCVKPCHEVCREAWHKDAKGEGTEALPLPVPPRTLPHGVTSCKARVALREVQKKDSYLAAVVRFKEVELDPYMAEKMRLGEEEQPSSITHMEAETYRLAPTDGLLEFKLILLAIVLWVPIVLAASMEMLAEVIAWRA